MAVYTVHQPPLGKGENAPDPARFTFVRDGFYVWGFLLSVLWMLRHRLWLVAVLFVALTVLIEVGLRYAGISSRMAHAGAAWRPPFLVGLEGATLRRWTLKLARLHQCRRRGRRQSDDAEQRFFVNWRPARGRMPRRRRRQPASVSARLSRHRCVRPIRAAPDRT